MKDWRYLKGKKVLVHASGIVYRGVVVELGPSSLVLKGTTGFQEIPWERITRMEEERAPGPGTGGGLPGSG
jgi:hypothetical protein